MEPSDVFTDPMAFSCGMRTNEHAVAVKTEPKDIEDLVVPTQFEQLTALGFGHMYDFDNLPELDPVYDFNGIKSEPGMNFFYHITLTTYTSTVRVRIHTHTCMAHT